MDWLSIKQPVLWIFAVLFTLLSVATATTLWIQKANPQKDYTELVLRVKSWWWMVVIFCVAISVSRNTAIVFFAILSFLALKEYLSLIPTRRADRRVLFWAYLTIPVQYLWVGMSWYGMFIIFIPVYAFLLLPIRMVVIGETKAFLQAVGTLHWGLMTTVFSISHVAFLLALPEANNPVGGGAGLVLFLVLLTQLNDVAQYIWGKKFGKHKITPKVSPNKTVEGFLGGVATTMLLALVAAPWLTPLNIVESILAGLIISVAGFIGDVTISALKRDIGVKDSSNLIPGHGGILDRIDSLTYTAPLFFHFVYYFHY